MVYENYSPLKTKIYLKLFNLIARELAPKFLKKGIRFSGNALGAFFEKQSERFWQACREIKFNDHPIGLDKLRQLLLKERDVLLIVDTKAS